MNKLLHRGELSVMFVGGPNERSDFHLEAGSELFYQLRGSMALPIVHRGVREVMTINEGDVFLLPPRIPHSPQRPEAGSLGLVIERERSAHEPPDGLRWYVDFHSCEEVLWERYFHCTDLGKDLVPVVEAFHASEEYRTGRPTGDHVFSSPPLQQDTTTHVPPPFSLSAWIDSNSDKLGRGESLNLFEGHPDREFNVRVAGGESEQQIRRGHESWLYQLKGEAEVDLGLGQITKLHEGACVIVPAEFDFCVKRPAGSLGMLVQNEPEANSRQMG